VLERKSGYAVIAKVSNKTANMLSHAIIKAPTPFEPRVKMLTYDIDEEFCGHALIDEALKSTGYFARLLANWERGSNGNVDGMLRQYVSKRRPMKNIKDEKIEIIENRLNNYTREYLRLRTPVKVFHQLLSRIALSA